MNINARSPFTRSTTISSRKFNQDRSAAKKLAEQGPVVITDRGRPTHVLLAYDAYERLSARPKSIVEMLAQPGADDDDFEIPKLTGPLFKPVDFD